MAAPRVWHHMLTVLLAAAVVSAGDGHNGVPLQKHSYYERDVFIPRNGTCYMGDQRVIGCVCLACNPHPPQAKSNRRGGTCRPLAHVHTLGWSIAFEPTAVR
jgi:hypothetical protein